MNYANLPSPGVVNGGFALRMQCARAISAIEALFAARSGHAGACSNQLAEFFEACAAACPTPTP